MAIYRVTVKDTAYQVLEIEAEDMDDAVDQAFNSHEIHSNISNEFELADSAVIENVVNTETQEVWEESDLFSGQLLYKGVDESA